MREGLFQEENKRTLPLSDLSLVIGYSGAKQGGTGPRRKGRWMRHNPNVASIPVVLRRPSRQNMQNSTRGKRASGLEPSFHVTITSSCGLQWVPLLRKDLAYRRSRSSDRSLEPTVIVMVRSGICAGCLFQRAHCSVWCPILFRAYPIYYD